MARDKWFSSKSWYQQCDLLQRRKKDQFYPFLPHTPQIICLGWDGKKMVLHSYLVLPDISSVKKTTFRTSFRVMNIIVLDHLLAIYKHHPPRDLGEISLFSISHKLFSVTFGLCYTFRDPIIIFVSPLTSWGEVNHLQ